VSNQDEHSAREFARRLAGLTPAAVLTRDRVLFEAGRNAGRKEARPWRYAASVMTVGFIGVLAFETWIGRNQPMASISQQRTEQPQIAEADVAMPPRSVARSSEASPEADYLRIRDLILQRGVEAMPRTAVASANPKKDETRRAAEENDGDGMWWRLRARQIGGTSR
jgi:hypothetical protein